MVQLEDGADRASTLELPESTSGPSEDKVVEDDIPEPSSNSKDEVSAKKSDEHAVRRLFLGVVCEENGR